MRILDLISRTIPRFPHIIIIFILIFFIFSIQSSKNVSMEQGYETYFSKEHKEFKQYKLFTKDYGVSISSIYVFIKGDDVVNYETFEFALKLGNELSKISGIGKIKSPAHKIIEKLGYLPTNEKELENLAYTYGGFYIPKRSMMLMEIEVNAQPDKFEQMAKEIEARIKSVEKPVGVVVEVTGNPVVRYQVNQSIKDSLKDMGIAAVILMILALIFTFRGVVEAKKYLLTPLLISIITATIAFGLMPILGIPLTEVTNAFFPVLIGLSIEYAAQFQARYEEERRKGHTPRESATNSIKNVGLALSLAMITTVIGFLSMLFSGVPSLGWFGILSALGLVIAYLLSLTFLPSLLIITDKTERKKERAVKTSDKILDFMAIKTSKRYKAILILTLIISLFGYYGYTNVGLQTDFYKYVPQDLPAIRKMNELRSIVGSQDRIIAVIEIDELNPETVMEIEKLANYVLQSESKITDYSSLGSVLKNYFGKIPNNDYEFELYLSKLDTETLSRYISGSSMAVYFTVSPMDWLEFKDIYKRVKEELTFYGISHGFYLTGDVVLKMFVADLIINGQNKMTLASYILVFILLTVVYRNVKRSVVPLIPITVVILATGGVMYVFDIDRTLISASLNSLTIGLGIDFSIHVMERYLEERRRGFSAEEAVDITVRNIGKPIITSGLTMAGGFAAMLVSPFPIMKTFGLVSVLAILLSLIAALTIVPAFLIFTDKEHKILNKIKKINIYN